MNIEPVAIFHSPLSGKFGVPRQSGLAESLEGWIELIGEYARAEAVSGLEGFEFIWLIWGFSLNSDSSSHLTVRPPRLGGNRRVGVFASRSPFRPNPLGLSSVRVKSVGDGRIDVLGADLADGTPIFDIKPYVAYADSHPHSGCGFVDQNEFPALKVVIPEELRSENLDFRALEEVLSLDPRPAYQEDAAKNYGLLFEGHNVKFRVCGSVLTVTDLIPL